MSDANKQNQEEFKKMLKSLYDDPDIAEFRPIIQELLNYADIPEAIDPEYLINLYLKCHFSQVCHDLAYGAWQNAAKYTPKPKQRYFEDY